MFHIDGTMCDGDACQHWSHSDTPLSFAELKTKIAEEWER